jgi:hemerythrin superfamily protein
MDLALSTISPGATRMIRLDHSHVLVTFHRYKIDTNPRVKQGLVDTICTALEIHAQLEEEIFYPAIREVTDNEAIRKSVPEHDEMRRLIAQLRGMEATDPAYDDTVMELMRDVLHHVADEETILLPEAERVLADRLGELGAAMTKRRMQLVLPRSGEIASDMARSIPTPVYLLGGIAGLACLTALGMMRRDKAGWR